jgi:O-acetyl-ADP-ribose deacetylase (regulator of RNase III)
MSRTPAVLASSLAGVRLEILIADITTLELDAIVNAANTSLVGGGGVDGAIHRAAGKGLLAECRALGGCETGDAKITRGYLLPARHVIHAVGPIWGGDTQRCDRLLASCYEKALALARENALASIAFPAISTGVYRFPAERAAKIAVGVVKAEIENNPEGFRRIVFCCFSEAATTPYSAAFETNGLEPLLPG